MAPTETTIQAAIADYNAGLLRANGQLRTPTVSLHQHSARAYGARQIPIPAMRINSD